jgi:NAD(P)H-dependent FMN reductase
MLAKETGHRQAVGIIGSPRRGGNTEILVDEVLRGAQEAGAHVERVILSELDVAPCRACDRCLSIGECVQKDDLPVLLEQMQRSQIWVLGTPVYWSGPTAQFKAFLDRWYSARRIAFEDPHVILVMPMGEPDTGYADCAVQTVKTALAYLRVESFATILAPGVWGLGEVREYPGVIEAAYRAGQESVTDRGSQAAPPAPQPAVGDEATMWVDDPSRIAGPHLVVTGAPIPLPKDSVLIGRAKPGVIPAPDVDMVPHGGDQMGVSRQHARMLHGPDGWVLEDLNSTNGTCLNGKPVPPGQQARVGTGDIVRFGTLTLVFYE